ncbi:hypothetical protein ASD30_14675 [Nocardioides sp. Root140]|nr:hypothetical protein ASD30_14675 [Nocardioides sp. Root140]
MANDDTATVEGGSANGNVLTNDIDLEGDGLNAALWSAPVNGTIILWRNGDFTYTPNLGFQGTDTFLYNVCDDDTPSLCDEGRATITVDTANRAPTAVDDSVTGDEEVPTTGNVLTNDTDPEGDGLTAALVGGPTHGTVVLNADGSFTYTPDANFNGEDSLAPVATDDPITTVEDVPTTGNVLTNDSDPDGDTLTVSEVDGEDAGIGTAISTGKGGSLTLEADGSFTYTPAADHFGPDEFHYTVTDPDGLEANGLATIEVGPSPDAPVTRADGYDATAGETLTVSDRDGVLGNDSDPDTGAPAPSTRRIALAPRALAGLSAAVDVEPRHGNLTLSPGGGFTYTPTPGYVGSDSFTYTASNAAMTSAPQLVRLRVAPADTNPAPTTPDGTTTVKGPASGADEAGLPDTGGPPLGLLWLGLALVVGGGVLMRSRGSLG